MKDGEHRKERKANLRNLEPAELIAREQEVTEELFWLRFKQKSGQLEKPANVLNTRRLLAQIKTIRAEKEREEQVSKATEKQA